MTHVIAFDGFGLNRYIARASIPLKESLVREKRRGKASIDQSTISATPISRLVCCFSLESNVDIAPSMVLVSINIGRASAISMLAGVVPSTLSPGY